jgi:hypothetical protein
MPSGQIVKHKIRTSFSDLLQHRNPPAAKIPDSAQTEILLDVKSRLHSMTSGQNV